MDGIMDNDQLIDSLIVDCNEAVGAIASGKYIRWCQLMHSIVQRLALLQKGVRDELKNRDDLISSLILQMNESGVDVKQMPVGEFLREHPEIMVKEEAKEAGKE